MNQMSLRAKQGAILGKSNSTIIISHFVGTNNIFVYCMYYTDHAA